MKDFKTLKFLDLFKKIFMMFGVNYQVMRRILQVKLIMDGRRVPTVIGNSARKKKERNNFITSLWIYALTGLILIPFVIFKDNLIFYMSIIFGIMMFMITSALISDFSQVILDIRDKNIISSKPVSNKTLSCAKAIHVFIYMFFLTIAMCGPALLISLIIHGIGFFLIFLIELILMDLLIVMITTLLYLLILQFFDGEKLKDIINYFQIFLSIAIAVGYQLLIRLFNIVDLNVVFEVKWWQYFIIPVWFGAPFEVLLNNTTNTFYVIFSLLALITPILSILLFVKFIPKFETNLQKLNNSSAKVKKRKSIFNGLLNKLNRNKQERVFFDFALNMIKREREFKLKVYPSLGLSIVLPFIFIFNFVMQSGFSSLKESYAYFYIYWCGFMLPLVVMMMSYSINYKGAWIYKTTPIKDISLITKGALKAFIIRLLVPVFLIESVIFMFLFKANIYIDLIIVFLTILIMTVLVYKMTSKSLPFSKAIDNVQQSQVGKVLGFMALLALFAGIHFGLSFVSYGLYIYAFLLLILNVILWKKGFNTTWENIE